MSEDKRVKHSKERITKAMVVCLESTSLDKITVKQICDTADVNRSTFYAHYQNPLELYKTLEQSMTDGVNRHFRELKKKTVTYKEFLRHSLEFCYENSDLFLALYYTDSISLKKSFIALISSYDFYSDTVPEDEKRYTITFYFSGTFSVIARWLRKDREKSIDDMVNLIYRLTKRQR